jgi:hypothetical protein
MEGIAVGIVLVVIGLAVGLVVVWRFGRQIARFVLAALGLGVAGLIGWALLTQAQASQAAAQAARASARGQTVATLLIGALLAALAVAVGVALYWRARALGVFDRLFRARVNRSARPRRRERRSEPMAPPTAPAVYWLPEVDEDPGELEPIEWLEVLR